MSSTNARRLRLAPLTTLLLALLPSVASAQIMAGPSDDVESVINGLEPGNELILADGTYDLSGRFGVAIAGTDAEPIVIRAADGAAPHFRRGDASENIWDLDVAYVTIRGLRFSGGSAGLRFEAGSNVTIEDCEIFGTADVALRMNDSGQDYTNMQILRNHIHDTDGTGEGMYLGCNENGCRLSNSLIANNYVHHTNQSSVSQGDGIEIKEGSFGNVVRDNVIHDTNYPCILVYSTVGNGAANVIERNAMWNCGDNAIQAAADATIRNNIILSAGGTGIAMQPHQNGAPGGLTVTHNTILKASGDAIAVRGAVGTVVVANNAVFAMSGRAILINGGGGDVTTVGNAGEGGVEGATALIAASLSDLFDANYGGATPNDVCPAVGSALIGAGDAAHAVPDDFNGTVRSGTPDIGARVFDPDGNPGWTLQEGFKDATAPPPGTDAGVPGVDSGTPPGNDGGPGVDSGTPPGTDGGSGADGGAAGGGDDGGCGCSTSPPRGSGTSLALLAIALVFVRRRSRRGE